MTTEQKNRIVTLRKAGYGYTAVARELGLTKAAVSKYCHKVGLTGIAEKNDLQLIETRGNVTTTPEPAEKAVKVTYHFAEEPNEEVVPEVIRILANISVRRE